jgi:hypothetical protein
MAKKQPPVLPTTIRVLGAPHKIEWESQALAEGDYGDYDEHEHVIRIGNRRVAVTTVHELTHAILNVSGLSSILDDKQNEAVCAAMENGLTPLVPFLSRVVKMHPEAPKK